MISIVIPLLNEEENVEQLYARLTESSPLWKEDYEILFVDDGSTDNTLCLLQNICQQDSRISIVKLTRNFGHQAAISAGMAASKGDAVIIMDGDLQDPPEELPRFLKKWREGYQVVYAIRTKRKENIIKRIAYSLFYRILHKISDIEIPLDSGDFCVMDRKVVDTLTKEMLEQSRFVRGLRAYAGYKQIGVEYVRAERAAGEVKYTFKKLLKLAMDGLFDFSTVPLKLATYLGFIISIPSFIIGIFFIFHRLLDFKVLGHSPSDTPGLATLTVGMFFLGGIMMIMLGVIGEYIARIYFEVKKRPFYIIEEIISQNNPPKSDK
ncbi:MAG: glycosyltransferase family 2 protein [Bacteroidales bacterium]|jgi:glycosyltransferase involved in cell wall biosynthesis|nr:glycosyltransferase family 2 protein [Bacteroidales bacterium]